MEIRVPRPTTPPRRSRPQRAAPDELGLGVLGLQRLAGNTAVASLMRSAAAGSRRCVQRRVEMRDVGRGEASGFARLPELVDRLNAMSTGVTYSMDGSNLAYRAREDGTATGFDTQMMGFIDQGEVIPIRLANHEGLLGDKAHGFNDRITEDAFVSGYADVDDLLASSDLGLQSVLVHFLTERGVTRDYARRLGTPGLEASFERGHRLGIEAETRLLRDFFSDPSVRFLSEPEGSSIFRIFRNGRRDTIRTRVTARRGIDAVTVEVVTRRDGVRHTPEEYRDLVAAERAAAEAAPGEGAAGGEPAGEAAAP